MVRIIVIKFLNKPRLGFHIQEIPPSLELKPTYDAARVNRKLRAQVGNSLYDSMVGPYSDLYEYFIALLREGGMGAIASIIDDEQTVVLLRYFLKTPGLRRRLEDVAFIDARKEP